MAAPIETELRAADRVALGVAVLTTLGLATLPLTILPPLHAALVERAIAIPFAAQLALERAVPPSLAVPSVLLVLRGANAGHGLCPRRAAIAAAIALSLGAACLCVGVVWGALG